MKIRHQQSGVEIEGIRLGPGAVLRKGDRYDSTSGSWECVSWCCVGTAVAPQGSSALWVRPGRLSSETSRLLKFLAETGYLLTDWPTHWKLIPGPQWQLDGRMDWRVDPGAAEDLHEHGLVEPIDPSDLPIGFEGKDDRIFRLSRTGRELQEALPA